MKRSKEYTISAALFVAAIVLFVVSAATSLFVGSDTSIDKTCMFLGFALFGFGCVYLKRSKS